MTGVPVAPLLPETSGWKLTPVASVVDAREATSVSTLGVCGVAVDVIGTARSMSVSSSGSSGVAVADVPSAVATKPSSAVGYSTELDATGDSSVSRLEAATTSTAVGTVVVCAYSAPADVCVVPTGAVGSDVTCAPLADSTRP